MDTHQSCKFKKVKGGIYNIQKIQTEREKNSDQTEREEMREETHHLEDDKQEEEDDKLEEEQYEDE